MLFSWLVFAGLRALRVEPRWCDEGNIGVVRVLQLLLQHLPLLPVWVVADNGRDEGGGVAKEVIASTNYDKGVLVLHGAAPRPGFREAWPGGPEVAVHVVDVGGGDGNVARDVVRGLHAAGKDHHLGAICSGCGATLPNEHPGVDREGNVGQLVDLAALNIDPEHTVFVVVTCNRPLYDCVPYR